jgi:hypothetical protein
MRENCTSGIAPGAPGNRRSYGGGSGMSFGLKSLVSSVAERLKDIVVSLR